MIGSVYNQTFNRNSFYRLNTGDCTVLLSVKPEAIGLAREPKQLKRTANSNHITDAVINAIENCTFGIVKNSFAAKLNSEIINLSCKGFIGVVKMRCSPLCPTVCVKQASQECFTGIN